MAALNLDIIFDVFWKNPIQDAAHFEKHLSKVFPMHLSQVVEGTQVERRKIRATLFEKIFMLQKALRNSTDPQAMRYEVSLDWFMIATILPRGCWDRVGNSYPDGSHRDPLQWGLHLYQDCEHLFHYPDSILTQP